jgi:hypothetical protein
MAAKVAPPHYDEAFDLIVAAIRRQYRIWPNWRRDFTTDRLTALTPVNAGRKRLRRCAPPPPWWSNSS